MAAALAAMPKEILLVGGRLLAFRPAPGVLETERRQHSGRADGAVEVLATSFAPNRYVVAVVRQDQLLIHRLVR